ncbi:MaoC family dehydratase [Pseudoduganella sp. RAF53_2]|uniref:MaoC family dehydratase n=1 Tax=unclassified Pseudoduganella TaxID=2637179 RepID=UPI003F99F202
MANRYLEDLQVGEKWASQPFTIAQQDVIDFGKGFDPQPMHTDPEAAANGPFGGLIASGWQLASLAMRKCVEARLFGDLPVVGVGIDELRWLQPVRPGDVLHVDRELVEVITLPDKPKRGIAKARVELKNQNGDVVMRMYGLSSVPKRPTA